MATVGTVVLAAGSLGCKHHQGLHAKCSIGKGGVGLLQVVLVYGRWLRVVLLHWCLIGPVDVLEPLLE